MGWTDEVNKEASINDGVVGYTVTVVKGADDPNDEVLVTFDSDQDVTNPIPVEWRRQLGLSGVTPAWTYPQNGDNGMVIFRDEDTPWLIW